MASHPAHAIQAACDDQTARDLQRHVTYQHECGVITCERARFWRGRYTHALNENDHLRRHMRLRGMPIPPIRDGHQADHAWLAPGRQA